MISPAFLQSIQRGLSYWQEQTRDLTDEAIEPLDAQRRHLYRIVTYGLALDETWPTAVTVVLQAFALVEQRGYWQEWQEVIETALARCPVAETQRRFKLLCRLGQLQQLGRRLPEAAATHHAAAALARDMGDELALAEADMNLLETYFHQRQYDEAERHGRTALAAFRRLEAAPQWLAYTLRALGDISLARGQPDQARHYLTQAVAIWRSLARPVALARALNVLAHALWAAERDDKALACYDEAAALLASTSSEFDQIAVHINRGALSFKRGHYAEAEAAFRQADSAYLRRSGHVVYRALVANNLGNALLKQGRAAEAEAHLRHARDLWARADDNLQRANTLGTLAEALAAQGRATEARPLYNEALSLLAGYPDDAWARKLLTEFRQQRDQITNNQ